jgi:hypothetical protein
MNHPGLLSVLFCFGLAPVSCWSADAPAASNSLAFAGVDRDPVLVAPGVVSTGDDEAHATLSPNGRRLYFLKSTPSFDFWTLAVSEWRGTAWSRPRTLPFSGQYSDGDLAFAPDGKRAYFVSRRPVDGVPRSDTEIWTVEVTAGGFGEPKHVPALSSLGDEWFPTLTRDGTMYFGSSRPGGEGGHDIWRAAVMDGVIQRPENVGPPVNTAGEEIEALVSPDGSRLIIAAKDRGDAMGEYDLYLAERREDGSWEKPRNLGPPINSTGWDFGPRLSPDGRLFFFTSNRGFGSSPLLRALTFEELEQRVRSPQNGLRDIYVVDAAVLERGSAR